VEGFFTHFFSRRGIFSEIFLEAYENDGDSRTAFGGFFYPLGDVSGWGLKTETGNDGELWGPGD
jgi:hypothetical protein